MLGAPFASDDEFLRELLQAMRHAGEVSPNGLPVGQYAAVSALDFLTHKPQEQAAVGEIGKHTNRALGQMGEEIRLTDRKVGAILKRLGFPRRERGGDDGPYQLEFTESVKRYIHRLVKFYGAWQVELYRTKPRVMCPLCREYKLVSDHELRYYENEMKPAEQRRKREKEAEFEQEMERLRKNPPQLIIDEPADAGAAKSQR